MPPRVNFFNVFTHIFYVIRYRKQKKTVGPARVKAAGKMMVKLTSDVVFLVSLGMSSFSARHKELLETLYLVGNQVAPSWVSGRT